MVRTKQGGSVLSFVIGGVFLAALLVGGIYWMSQQNQTRNTPMPTPQAPQETKPADESVVSERQQPQPQASTEQLPSNGPVQELPATGPREVFVASLAVALLSGVGISYIRSRRHTASL
jgi:hypothetical protein